MTKLEETNDFIKRYYEDDFCILSAKEKALFDIAKSLAIIVDNMQKNNKGVIK